MSPFVHAGRIEEPFLLVHGRADNDSGTFPMESERLDRQARGTADRIFPGDPTR